MSLQARHGLIAVGVAQCRHWVQTSSAVNLKASMCSLWGPLATLDHLVASARGGGALRAAAFAAREDALESQVVRQASPEVQDRGVPLEYL